MAFGIALVIGCLVLYTLIVKGVLWKILVGLFAFLGMHTFLLNSFQSSHNIFLSIGDSTFSYAAVIPVFVIFMASFYTRD